MKRIDRALRAVLLAGAALLVLSPASRATTTMRVASGLQWPVFATSPPNDPRLFIVQQRGIIRILSNGQLLPTPFLNIDPLIPDISGSDERGLLGLTFDPQYGQNGRFYVYYYSLHDSTIIARYHVSSDPNVADPNSGQMILKIAQPYANHNGGTILFGPDGFLYLGTGDGGSAGDPGNRAQNPLELLGKMLRIDVSGPSGYTIPPSNPFAGNPAYRPEIWALGMRNPYRYSFDRQTGDLWIADVGQNLWEEVDFQPANSAGGQNYGWRLMEATHCFNPPTNCDDGDPVLTYPIHEYSHSLGCSVTGGYVYRGSAIPSLQGAYFFADWCSAKIWSLRYDGSQVTDFTDHTAEFAPGGGMTIDSPAGFGQDSEGELYIVDRGTGADGEVYKIVSDPADTGSSPVAAGGLRLTAGVPNPFAASVRLSLVLPGPATPQVQVMDLQGRVVRDLSPRAGGVSGTAGNAAGNTGVGASSGTLLAITWDGKDQAGRACPSAVYFVTARADGKAVTRRVQLLR